MTTRIQLYLDAAYGDTCAALAARNAWLSAVHYKAPHALRRELRSMMRMYALRAVALARRQSARDAARNAA